MTCKHARVGHPFDLATLNREIDIDGIGWAPARARGVGMLEPVVVFIRDDGWSLGAGHAVAERQAVDAYRSTWALFARAAEGWRLRPFSEYYAKGESS